MMVMSSMRERGVDKNDNSTELDDKSDVEKST